MRLRSTLSTVAMAGIAAVAAACSSATADTAAAPPSRAQNVNRDAQIQNEFTARVNEYVALRNEVASEVPKLSKEAEPEEMAAHQAMLLKTVGQARRNARPGDLFQPETQSLIRRMLRDARRLPAGAEAKSAIQDENPGPVKLRINGEYPDGLPLATVPPQVLLSLPRLPDEGLEYRFVGRRLLLIDSRARMVVDYMENALP